MALTKTTADIGDDWQEVAQNAVEASTILDIGDSYSAALYINCAVNTETAHTGTKIEIQIRSDTNAVDEHWHTFRSFISSSGTAVELAIDNGSEQGPVVETDVTGDTYDDDETRWIFFEDKVAPTASEIGLLISSVPGTSVTLLEALTNAKETDDKIYNIVDTWVVELPFAADTVRVIYDNTFDPDGSTVFVLTRVTKVTGI